MVTPTKSLGSSTPTAFKTPLNVRGLVNDDEQERSARRSLASSASLNETFTDIDDNEDIKTCISRFQENKITKDNAWNNPLIDTLVKLVSNHRRQVRNFQVCGLSLEASTRIYNMRVDSVHDDVMRMSTDLARLHVKKNANQGNTDDVGDEENVQENDGATNSENNKGKGAVKKKKKPKATVTKCKESINAKLDKIPFMDPFFAELKTHIGEVGTSNRAFMNRLESINSELVLGQHNRKFFDKSPVTDLNSNNVDENESMCRVLLPKVSDKMKLRTLLHGYRICDTPMNIEDILNADPNSNDDDYDDNHMCDDDMPVEFNRSQVEVAFDINAEVEPIPCTDIQSTDINITDIDQVDEFSDNFVQQRRYEEAIIVHSMQPETAKTLEYSYRDLDINKFWAGPSYWKIKPKRRSEQPSQRIPHKKATKRRVKNFEPKLLSDCDSPLIRLFNPEPKQRVAMRNWDSKKLLLPLNHRLDEDCITCFMHLFDDDSGNVQTNSELKSNNVSLNSEVVNDIADNNDNHFDDGCTQENDDNLNLNDPLPETNPNIINTTFAAEYEGAPEKLEKIILPYSTISKNIDMKQYERAVFKANEKQKTSLNKAENDFNHLKKYTSHLKEEEYYEEEVSKFSDVYMDTKNYLDRTQRDNVSPGLVFLAELQNANSHGLRFIPDGDRDFKIYKIKSKLKDK